MTLFLSFFSQAVYPHLGGGNGTPLQCSCLENPMDGGAWYAVVHGVAKSRTWLSDFTFTFHFHALEKEMATHSSVFAWRILGTAESGGLPSMGSHRVGHDWSDLAEANPQLFRPQVPSPVLVPTVNVRPVLSAVAWTFVPLSKVLCWSVAPVWLSWRWVLQVAG